MTPEPGHMTICSIVTRSSGTIAVSAVATTVPELMITPAIAESEAGVARIDGGEMQLTHIHTGRSVMRGEYTELQDLAAKLSGISWTFTDPEHFKQPANSAVLQQIQAIIRDWMMADDHASSAPINLMFDHEGGEEEAAARGVAPAATLLREQIDWFLKRSKNHYENLGDLIDNKPEVWMLSTTSMVYGYGVIYLLAVLRTIDPSVADIAARDLYRSWDHGEFGEFVYEWAEQLAAGKPLTLYGIPRPDTMVDFTAPKNGEAL